MVYLNPKQPQTKSDFDSIQISLASPELILSKSYGEVTKPETINYRSYKPEKDGLFCEKIFGPVKDWECHCGKYKRIRYKGIICDRCGVEVTRKKVRRERMGHINLAVPVVHIWYLRSIPSKLSYILGLSTKDLEKVIYYEEYIVISAGGADVEVGSLVDEEEYMELRREYGPPADGDGKANEEYFEAGMGGEAIREILAELDMEKLANELQHAVDTETSKQRKNDALKRLKVVRAFIRDEDDKPNNPEWMVLSVLPVIPPELRPLVPLDGGRFAASDLNDLYRRVIIRNNRLKQLIDINAPDVILRNEKRMLQESVDSLFDNSRRRTAVRSGTRRPLKSLSDMLKGKQGRFRQNLLGKRVDYSGRSVIVVGPELQLNECGLPKEMAIELFKPFIINQLITRGYSKTPRSAKLMVEEKQPEIYEVLEYVVKDHPVLLNRAPTLHRLGIQAFQPVLIDGKAIKIHPLVCAAFNADFDGDQMAVHVPLGPEAQMESRMLMLSSHNILHPAHGAPIAIPSQDMVLGVYYLTRALPGDKGEGMTLASRAEARVAYDNGEVGLHAKVKLRLEDGKQIDTTIGRIFFNDILPEEMPFINELVAKKSLEGIVGECFERAGNYRTVKFLDDLKDLGFGYATSSGSSIGLDDVMIPEKKHDFVDRATAEVEDVNQKAQNEILTEGERYNKVIDIWTHTTNAVADTMMTQLARDKNGFNNVFMMADSGARGSKDQIKQLAGMRGLMAKPQKSMTGQAGEIIEDPILSNFKEGLSAQEYFISTHGARKGLADTALKTADAGYLTRRLVDVSQDVVIAEEDCGTINGLEITALKEGEEIIEPLEDRILGRFAVDDVYNPITDEMIVGAGEMIDEDVAHEIGETALEEVRIRSVLTCETRRGVCIKCYGRHLATNKVVNIGESVGIIAAQSIGEPGTQLTLRTFHIGGTASRIVETSEMTSKHAGTVRFSDNIELSEREDGDRICLVRNGRIDIIDENNRELAHYNVPYGSKLLVEDEDEVEKGQTLFAWDPYSDIILARRSGYVKFIDLIDDVTYSEETDELGRKQSTIIESKDRDLSPRIEIVDEEGETIAPGIILPVGANLVVKDGQEVEAGDTLVKIAKEIGKTRDITGGLPRVAELFEARKPKNPAVVSEIDGRVKFGRIRRGVREIIVVGDAGDERSYKIPYGKHVIVHEGDRISAGDRLCDGAVAPHDILRILGPGKVQEYLVNEIQEVYRLQGVRINDKHIEVIVRQMMQKVAIEEPGDTKYLEKDRINRYEFFEENERIRNMVVVEEPGDTGLRKGRVIKRNRLEQLNTETEEEGGEPAKMRAARLATFRPLLLGITRASLNTESFMSAASFQETTRVLTDAATSAKIDHLRGLKENVIMGRLIPAGTGQKHYKNIIVDSENDVLVDERLAKKQPEEGVAEEELEETSEPVESE
ncbi:MAG: DNA-directed RNA polymerase subunit beta' [Candidatus Marinimicrobia bacterium]|nr:DNA-directed RNA polymerase subunit beta' [Candidatus Neomarinimicrobiota bacterium]MCF7827466.1 DNA-directed RNA polymerase subunit beta' [Candidatus Neomarinimicrobiota bacterium]MCF7882421.1 DNA-directed RNA polymerase subunit beta' [Candidatus Neomarinimicrobiota bacterium]